MSHSFQKADKSAEDPGVTSCTSRSCPECTSHHQNLIPNYRGGVVSREDQPGSFIPVNPVPGVTSLECRFSCAYQPVPGWRQPSEGHGEIRKKSRTRCHCDNGSQSSVSMARGMPGSRRNLISRLSLVSKADISPSKNTGLLSGSELFRCSTRSGT